VVARGTFAQAAEPCSIADASAIQLFGELLLLPEEMQTRQWGAMSAPAPVRLQCQQKNCLSRAGSRYLHKAR